MLHVVASSDEEQLNSIATELAFHRFSIIDIQLATQNFDDDLVIGKGGFGKVYKGRIRGSRDTTTERLVAIKRLDSLSMQGAAEFMNEIKMLTQVRHCNLVSLIGYCWDNNEMMLVYEYMPNGTIENHLHEADTPLTWMDRLKISIGAAQGLQYLHTGVASQHGIIHRDVKSSNILLDENWTPKISDFGLSKIVRQQSSGVITHLKGTFGYLDPEYCNTGKLTKESDVYSFGVVLFELLSGRRAVDTPFVEEGINLAGWVKKCMKERRLDQVVSSHIASQISPRCLKEFVQIADRCSKNSRKERPKMADVVVALQQSMALQEQYDSSPRSVLSMGFTHKMQHLLFGSRPSSVATTSANPLRVSPSPTSASPLRVKPTPGRFSMTPKLERISFVHLTKNHLEVATQNFSPSLNLGKGGFGTVYKAQLPNGQLVAVKRAEKIFGSSSSYSIIFKELSENIIYIQVMLSVVAISDEEKLNSLATERAFHRFSLAEILSATQNFDDDLVVGKGGFGKVYKGRIYGSRDTTARLVAIKRLDSFSRQGPSEFMTEIEMLSKLRHCHLVSLIGYCSDDNESILVYEYMPNGTIEHHLHKTDIPLSWMHRLKISIGAARGLDYLHTGVGTQQGIIHRDVKSSNILLDENWEAKIADFGLSKIIDQRSSGVSTGLKGTFGYLDPEYYMTGHLTRKSDVYSFGVVLFELLSGRRAVDTRFREEQWNLANWAKKCVKERRVDQLVSSHIIAQISPKCLKEFVQIADRCLKGSRKKRPTMADVVVALQQSLAFQGQFDSSAQAAGSTGFTYKMQYLLFGSRHNSGDPETPSSTHNGHMDYSFRIYSYRDMERATRNFSNQMLLGHGHYGEVYKGWLDKKTFSPSTSDSGLLVVVKRLYTYKSKPHMINEKMKILEEFNDPNVVKILGYCTEEDTVLIIYEFMHQGTLNDYLFSVERRTERHLFISRVKIAIGVARGLIFLRTQPQLANCSLQMHNILLDKEFNAKLSDFDVAILVPDSDAPLYLTPTSSYYLKVKSGVFGFGVLLMELLTGEPIASESGLTATRQCLPGEHGFVSLPTIYGALDCRIKLNFLQTKPAVQLALLAQKCVVDKSYLRPTLESVLEELEEIYIVLLNIGASGN